MIWHNRIRGRTLGRVVSVIFHPPSVLGYLLRFSLPLPAGFLGVGRCSGEIDLGDAVVKGVEG